MVVKAEPPELGLGEKHQMSFHHIISCLEILGQDKSSFLPGFGESSPRVSLEYLVFLLSSIPGVTGLGFTFLQVGDSVPTSLFQLQQGTGKYDCYCGRYISNLHTCLGVGIFASLTLEDLNYEQEECVSGEFCSGDVKQVFIFLFLLLV